MLSLDASSLPPTFSIVIPVYNEEASLDELVAAIERAMRDIDKSYEIVLVDDGSTDRSLDKLKRLAATREAVRVFSFRRNLGKSLALLCGFQMATGEYILTMDADLQDDPDNLSPMFEYLVAQRVDIVGGWRKNRRDSALKVAASKVFNLTVRVLFGFSFKDMNSGLKLYKADVARDLQLYGGMHRFIPLIASEMGYRVAEFPVRHRERKYGSSKYTSAKILTEIPDLLTVFFLVKYTTRPLHFFGRIGSVVAAIGLVCLAYLTILWAQSIPIGTRPLLAFGVLMVLIGGQTVFTGLLADLIVAANRNKMHEFRLKYTSDLAPGYDRLDSPGPTGLPVGSKRD
ncbi:MAG: glycosyltransferase [Luteitalea sp.]|nr:glycosyltransferase [Luteitalea sp.]